MRCGQSRSKLPHTTLQALLLQNMVDLQEIESADDLQFELAEMRQVGLGTFQAAN